MRITIQSSSKAPTPDRFASSPSISTRLRRFRQENIQDTVVFFGSARVHSRQRAERALKVLQQKRGRKAKDHELLLKRSRKAVEWSRYYEEARELAHMLTDMEPVARGAAAPLRGVLRRRPGNHGSGQPRRQRSRRQDDRA